MPAFEPCVHGKRLFGARAPSGARRNHIPRPHKASYTDKLFRGIRTGASPENLSLTSFLPLERITGIEPASSAWEADVLPMNYIRIDFFAAGISMIGKNRVSACIEARFLMQQVLLG